MKKAPPSGLVLLLTVLALICPPTSSAGVSRLQVTYLLKMRPGVPVPPARLLSGTLIGSWSRLGVPGWLRVTFDQGALSRVLSQLETEPDILVVQQDHLLRTMLTPNDAYWAQQWGPAQVHAPAAWDVTTGRADVVVAVLDTGMDVHHDDLLAQLWTNPGEVPGNSLDDDANGKVDDIHGWRFTHDALGYPNESNDIDDDHGHGTHVAGILAATGDNTLGIAGMAWGCRLMILKVLDSSGQGYESDVAQALVYAVDNGARIASLSLAGTEDSALMRDAVDYAQAHGALVVAAAGNNSTSVLYPAAYPGVLAVAASDASDQRAPYSSYGPEVDLTAPGSSIYSTWRGNTYEYQSGTSMATPHVAGLAALIWSNGPDYTAAEVRQVMIITAHDIGSPGWDPYTGWGRIDASAALSSEVKFYKSYLPYLVHGADPPFWPWLPVDP